MMWVNGLLVKMYNSGIRGWIFKWIRNFLNGRSFQVQIKDTLSDQMSSSNGCPQGSVISPILFLLMINDLH